jgi:hypothetical protein
MMRPVPVPIDEKTARVARQRAAYQATGGELDVSLWAGILFWLGFAAIAVVAGL